MLVRSERLCADAACHRDKTRAHPGGIGSFRSEYSAVGSEFSTPVGAVLDARRTLLHVGRAILYLDGAFLELVAVLDDFWFCRPALIRRGMLSRFLTEMLAIRLHC